MFGCGGVLEQIVNRKPIFDAVRVILGRGFSQPEVDRLDRAIDLALAAPSFDPAQRLGSVSARYESGGRGAGTVSSGAGDPGGVSYGIYQLSSRAGTAAAFVATEGAPWAATFAGAKPGTAAFATAWKAIAAREPDDFAEAQHRFIERTHYQPAIRGVLARTGFDLDERHLAVREATWSVAVQHGGAVQVLASAIERTRMAMAAEVPGFDRQLVEDIYLERAAYVLRVAERSGAAERRVLQSIVRNRYPAELADVLKLFEIRS